MKDRHYAILLTDSTGRGVRRFSVSRRLVVGVVGATASAALLLLLFTVHGLVLRHRANVTDTLTQENVQLVALLDELQHRLPAVRRLAQQNENNFMLLWKKSGLGIEPRLLGAGPLDAPHQLEGPREDTLSASFNGEILRVAPLALPVEVERVQGDARDLRQTLAEQFEYFHDAQRLLSNTPSIRPARSVWLTSSFGRRRDPMSGVTMMHKGLDLGGFVGKEILAPADGVVIWTGRRGGYGLTVVLDHGYGLQTHYAHLSKFRVQLGDRVQRGDVIAEMGSTGKSTGPHLHYEVRRLGHPLNPTRFILD